jgi:hypothetical protein
MHHSWQSRLCFRTHQQFVQLLCHCLQRGGDLWPLLSGTDVSSWSTMPMQSQVLHPYLHSCGTAARLEGCGPLSLQWTPQG